MTLQDFPHDGLGLRQFALLQEFCRVNKFRMLGGAGQIALQRFGAARLVSVENQLVAQRAPRITVIGLYCYGVLEKTNSA